MWSSECVKEGVVTLRGVTCLIGNLLKPIPALIALAALAMIIFAGIRWISAGADPKALSSAQSALTWALVGIILLPTAWLLLILIERFTGAPITQFGLPQ